MQICLNILLNDLDFACLREACGGFFMEMEMTFLILGNVLLFLLHKFFLIRGLFADILSIFLFLDINDFLSFSYVSFMSWFMAENTIWID